MSKTERFSVARLLSIQINHFVTKDMFWSAISWSQIFILLAYGPEWGRLALPLMLACTTPDVQDGVVQKLTLQIATKEQEENCMLVPKGYMLTNA